MPATADREAPVDENFIDAVSILNAAELPYWICHGSLLGLVRDGRLIPWDHDIDIAVWATDVAKAPIVALMTSHGFTIKSDGADYDFASFTRGDGREVDFNFYKVTADRQRAYSEWFLPRSKLTTVLTMIVERRVGRGRWSRVIKRLYFARPVARALIALLKAGGLFTVSAGYTCPADLLVDFDRLDLHGLSIRVPKRREEILEFVYGSGWRVAKRNYDWVTESPSTVVSRERFK